MPYGHPDGQRSVIPGKTTFAPNQRSWYAVEQGSIASGSYSDFIDYEVPDGWTLHLCAGLIATDSVDVNHVALNFSPALLGNVYYMVNLALPLHPTAAYEISAGNTLYVRVYNDDEAAHNFTVSLSGFEEQIS